MYTREMAARDVEIANWNLLERRIWESITTGIEATAKQGKRSRTYGVFKNGPDELIVKEAMERLSSDPYNFDVSVEDSNGHIKYIISW